jgi:hypothetical protein
MAVESSNVRLRVIIADGVDAASFGAKRSTDEVVFVTWLLRLGQTSFPVATPWHGRIKVISRLYRRRGIAALIRRFRSERRHFDPASSVNCAI